MNRSLDRNIADQDDGGGSAPKSNDRYVRQHLRPIAKSVYSDKKVVRLNGSFNGSIGSTGLHMGMNEQSKGQMHLQLQQAMTQTFNMSVLNNSFNQGNISKTQPNFNLTTNTQANSPRGIRSLQNESFAPFTVAPNAKIPDLSETRKVEREDRVANLLRRPKHKCVNRLEAASQSDKLMSAPLTMEDKGQFLNLPLINTLRDNSKSGMENYQTSNLGQTGKNQGDEEEGDKGGDRGMETIPNPPSFFENDMEKWKNKFQKHIKERDFAKKHFAKSSELTCRTFNTNIREDDGSFAQGKKGSKKVNQRGASLDPESNNKHSLFNKVLKRRKSRQSNFGPGCLDFDYAGDSAQYDHLIRERKDLGQPNQSQLNFEMKLRTYRNVTEFAAYKPWCFPAVKEFNQKKQWDKRRRDTGLLNAEFKHKFNDSFEQKNANELLHQFDKRGINQTAMWQCQLRGLKREVPQKVEERGKSARKSQSPSKRK